MLNVDHNTPSFEDSLNRNQNPPSKKAVLSPKERQWLDKAKEILKNNDYENTPALQADFLSTIDNLQDIEPEHVIILLSKLQHKIGKNGQNQKIGNLFEKVLEKVIIENKQVKELLMKKDFAQFHGLERQILNELAENERKNERLNLERGEISKKFDRLGLIDSDDVALILAAKMNSKSYENSIFSITDKDVDSLNEQIKNLILSDSINCSIKFQIVFFSWSHATFGEFEIDKTVTPPIIRYLHCDPFPGLTNYDQIITSNFIEQISPLASIEIYDSAVRLQKGLGCSYFSIDGAMMLATPEQEYASNVMEHIQKNGKETSHDLDKKNIKYIKFQSLPTRFIRGMQYFEDGKIVEKGLDSLVLKNEEKNRIVNKKNETAENSILKDLEKRPTKLDPEIIRVFNTRIERKMLNYKSSVMDFIKDKDLFSSEFANQIDKFKIKGLVEFCEKKIGN